MISRRMLIGAGFAALAWGAQAVEIARAPVPAPRPAEIAQLGLPQPVSGAHLKARFGHSGVAGWMLVDLESGAVLEAYKPDEGFAPASVAKLPTALYALETLGAAHRFETRLLATGPVKNEVLQGDLILAGGHDPELDTDALVPLLLAAQKYGFRKITGRFLVDGGGAVRIPSIDANQAVDSGYSPAISGLNLNFNRVRLRWQGRRGMGKITLTAKAERLDPAVSRIKVEPVKAGPTYRHMTREGGEIWQIARRAFAKRKGERWLPVKEPELYAGDVLRGLAKTYGIALPAPELGTAPEDARELARVESRELTPILRDMLKYSTNLTAEVVGVAASRAVGIEPASLSDSAALMSIWASPEAVEQGEAAAPLATRFYNHSGLSAESRVTPRRMIALLRKAAAAGAPGVPHVRLSGPAAALLKPHNVAAEEMALDYERLDVVAKTGTMDFIRGLSGYIATPGGRRLAFAIFSNDLPRRRSKNRGGDRRWMGRAKGFERALIRNWVLAHDTAMVASAKP